MYSSVYLALVQLLAKEIDTRLTNMAFLMVGIFGAHSVQTGKLAAYWVNQCAHRHKGIQLVEATGNRKGQGDDSSTESPTQSLE
jgi:hypothetical protein